MVTEHNGIQIKWQPFHDRRILRSGYYRDIAEVRIKVVYLAIDVSDYPSADVQPRLCGYPEICMEYIPAVEWSNAAYYVSPYRSVEDTLRFTISQLLDTMPPPVKVCA